MNEFIDSFFETLFWSETIETSDVDHEHYDVSFRDAGFGEANMSQEQRAALIAECEAFFNAHSHQFEKGHASAGHDFCLTRNHHGAGFWDGDYATHGDTLTDAANKYAEVNLYLGDDGLVHVE
jgi:hypothetical protein